MRKVYALLLNLFPRSYRAEYGDELLAVFNLSMDDAITRGRLEAALVVLHELISLPSAIIYEHLRERTRIPMIKKFRAYFGFEYGSYREFLTAMFPFLLVGGIWPLINILVRLRLLPGPGPVANGILLSLLGLFAILFLVGVGKGLPRWSLPYLGFILSLFSVYVFSGLLLGPIYLFFPNLYDRLLFFGDIFYAGAFWFGLLIVMILLVLVTRISPLFQRFRSDWTLLCFILYGAVPFALALTFDEYVGDEPYMLAAFLVLASGAWFYLRGGNEWKRFGALFGALTLAMFIAAAGKALLVPTQDWPITINRALSISEAKHTVLMWMWLALIMIVPIAINLLPRADSPSQASLTEG